MNGEPTLPFLGAFADLDRVADAADDAPLIYVASPLTRATTPQHRQRILFGIDKIVTTVQDRRDGDRRLLRTHAPAVLSAPWDGTHDPAEIFRQNSRLVLSEADALISLALDGGSDGTGQELAFANQRGMPVLRLSPDGDAISRQIRGNPMLDSHPYGSPDDLAIIVGQFLQRHSDAIFDGPRSRRSKTLVYGPLQQDLETAWRGQAPRDRTRVAGCVRIPPAQLDHVLTHPLLVASLTLAQINDLGTALAIDAASYFTSVPDPLAIDQIEALIIAKDEFGWTDADAAWLRDVARRELSGVGTKRLLLNSPADWLRLKDTIAR